MTENTLLARWRQTREDIEEAARKAGRDPESVQLIAVSKLHPYESIAELARAGQLDFGENYVQEAQEKQAREPAPGQIRWHFIGRLQSNKAKFVAGSYHLVHSLDRLKLARALNEKCLEAGCRQPVLLQASLAGEEQKGGVAARDALDLGAQILAMPGLELQGLMCMPPFFDDGERARPFFSRLRQLKENMEREMGIRLPHLSMGMTGDYSQAIEEGATLVRIGTRIFGERP